MKSLKMDYGGILAIAMLSLGFVLACGGVAQASPQYTLNCQSCHAMPPTDSGTITKDPFTGGVPGNHGKHATSSLNSCAKCHNDVSGYGNSHRNKAIEIDTAITYNRSHPAAFVNQTAVPPNPLGTCSTAACHSNGKGVYRATPAWGNMTAANCDTCHDSKPSTNSHTKHISNTLGYDYTCNKCHSDHAGEVQPFQHATSAGSRSIDVHFSTAPNSGGTFAANQCSNLYCHSDGKAVSPTTRTIAWGGTVTCASCHGDAAADTLSGKHARHVNNAAILGTDYGCVQCHSATVSDNSTIVDKAKHVDGTRDVSAACTVCHTNGKGADKSVVLANWSDATDLTCSGCHGSETAPAFASKAGEPNYANAGAGLAGANTHAKHVKVGAADCANCHSKTTISGAAIIGSQHTDGFINFTSGNGKTFGKEANKTCSNISCHSNGFFTPANAQWGATLDCSGCHNAAPSTGAHAAHLSTYGCVDCHNTTAATNSTLVTNGGEHMMLGVNVVGGAITTFNGTENTCATSCHMSATPDWDVPTSGQCGSCHSAYSDVTGGLISTNAHTAHFTAVYGPDMNELAAGNACATCHTYTGERTATHVNGSMNLAGGYSANGACSTCHKNTTNWTAAAHTLSCESCHTTAGGGLSVIGGTTAPDKTTAATSGHGKAGIAQACTVCHDNTSAHISGTLGDNNRLKAALGTDNANCLYCHNTSGTVSNPAMLSMKAHQDSGLGSKCADCHNAHGTANSMMVNGTINAASVSFTGNNSFATGTGAGVCEVCHTTTDYFKKTGDGAAHVDSTQNCLECHSHNPAAGFAFMPSTGCDACHGYPPAPRNAGAGTFGIQNNWSSARFEDYSGGGGAHIVVAHLAKTIKPSDGWAPCLVCHVGGDTNHAKALPVRTHVSNVTVKIDQQYRFSDVALTTYTSAKLTNDGTNETGGCFNVSCHFKTSPKWSTER